MVTAKDTGTAATAARISIKAFTGDDIDVAKYCDCDADILLDMALHADHS